MLRKIDWDAIFRRARFECAEDPAPKGFRGAGRPPKPGVLERDILVALWVASFKKDGEKTDVAVKAAETAFDLARETVYRAMRKAKPYLEAFEAFFADLRSGSPPAP